MVDEALLQTYDLISDWFEALVSPLWYENDAMFCVAFICLWWWWIVVSLFRAIARMTPITAVKKMTNATNQMILLTVTGEATGSNDDPVEEA